MSTNPRPQTETAFFPLVSIDEWSDLVHLGWISPGIDDYIPTPYKPAKQFHGDKAKAIQWTKDYIAELARLLTLNTEDYVPLDRLKTVWYKQSNRDKLVDFILAQPIT